MSNWRPEGWENPYPVLDGLDEGALDSLDDIRPAVAAEMTHKAFEAGADAMLGAVCEEIEKVENPQPHDSPYREIQCEYIGFELCRKKILDQLK